MVTTRNSNLSCSDQVLSSSRQNVRGAKMQTLATTYYCSMFFLHGAEWKADWNCHHAGTNLILKTYSSPGWVLDIIQPCLYHLYSHLCNLQTARWLHHFFGGVSAHMQWFTSLKDQDDPLDPRRNSQGFSFFLDDEHEALANFHNFFTI